VIVVVGWGPSLANQGLGKEIDDVPTVIRMPDHGHKWNPQDDHIGYCESDHGKKTDYFVTSAQMANRLPNNGIIPNKASWIFSRPGDITAEKENEFKVKLAPYKPEICREADQWLNRFIQMGARKIENRLPIPQTGAIAAILAMEKLHPKEIYLAGMDSYWDNTQSMRFMHDLNMTRKLLIEVAFNRGVRIVKF
jgi:hypothetical protein